MGARIVVRDFLSQLFFWILFILFEWIMGKSYELTNIVERGTYYGGDRYRVFYTVSQAATMMDRAKSGLQGRVQRKTIEHILLTDWNRKDTEKRPMIEDWVILCEKEKLQAKREKRKPQACEYQQIVIKPENDFMRRTFLPADSYEMLGGIINEHRGNKFEIEYFTEKKMPSNDPINEVAEIYISGDDILQVIPYNVMYRQLPNKKLSDMAQKFDILLIMQFSDTQTIQISTKFWNEHYDFLWKEKNFSKIKEEVFYG